MLVFFASFVALAGACAVTPDNGPATKATIEMDVKPPILWTFNTNAEQAAPFGQPLNSDDAIAKRDTDIKSAIRAVLIQENVPVDNADGTVFSDNMETTEMKLLDTCSATPVAIDPAEYLVVDQTVIAVCETGENISRLISVQITSKNAVARDRWEDLAIKLREQLMKKNVNFNKMIQITYSS